MSGRINVESPMHLSAIKGVDAYQPVFRGEPLEVEASLPEVSLRNLRKMIKAGLRVASVNVIEFGDALIVFRSGESYRATGFDVGRNEDGMGELVVSFAQFMSEVFGGSVSDWANKLSGYDDCCGYIDPSIVKALVKPRIHRE